MPIAGLAVSPLVASEPPHSVATIRSATPTGVRGTAAISASAPCTHSRPAWMVARVPPAFWITRSSHGRPEARISSIRRGRLNCSHPSDTTRTAPTFGWVQNASIMRWA
jgi:hypothetical protein